MINQRHFVSVRQLRAMHAMQHAIECINCLYNINSGAFHWYTGTTLTSNNKR